MLKTGNLIRLRVFRSHCCVHVVCNKTFCQGRGFVMPTEIKFLDYQTIVKI